MIQEIELHSVWRPKAESRTGIGIILRIQDIPEHRLEMYSKDNNFDGKLYHFITDFGNIVIYTKEEMLNNYEYIYTDDCPKTRLKRQLELLKEIEEIYFND